MNLQRLFFLVFLLTTLLLSSSCNSDDSSTENQGDQDTELSADDDTEAEAEAVVNCNFPVEVRTLEYSPDETFQHGPYLMQPLQTSIIVMWRTEEEEDGTVLYGLGDTLDLSASQQGDASNMHEILLEGLEPNTRYNYKVQSGERSSEVHHFTTAPDSDQGFNITLWGDSQDNPHIFAQLADHMATLNPNFVLGLGDYVSEGPTFSLWKERLFDPARGLFHEVAFYGAIGNHERNHHNWYDFVAYPHPKDNPAHESFYSFTYGNAFFLVFDTDKPYFPIFETDMEISAFIKEQVASPEAQAAKWRFALAHVPGYAEAWGDAECESYGGDLPIREWLFPLLNEYKFHAYFSGHMHGYERGQSDNLVTVISGGGGGGLDAWCVDLPQVSVAQYVHHHLHMEVGCNTVRITAYDLDGEKFDWVEITDEEYGKITDEGPIDDLPPPTVDPNSPTLNDNK